MKNVFILKTDANSDNFKQKIGEFFTTYCKDTDSNIAIFELSDSGKKKAEKIIAAK